MKKQRLMIIAAFGLLVIVATLIGCGTLGTDGFLIPVGQAGARFAFVVNGSPDPTTVTISAYKIDGSTGALTAAPGSPFSTSYGRCCGATYIDVDPASRFVFVPNVNGSVAEGIVDGTVSVLSVDQNTGALTAVGSPVDSGGAFPFAAKLDPTGKFLYVINGHKQTTSLNIAAFSVGSGGSLTAIGTPLTIPAEPYQLIMDPKGRFVYATVGITTGVMGWSINSGTGALTVIPNPPTNIFSLPCEGRSGTVDFTGTFLVVADRDCGQVSVFKIDQTAGTLSNRTDVQTDPTNQSPTNTTPFHVVEAASGGKFFMAVNNNRGPNVAVFEFDPTTGSLTAVSGSPFTLNNFSRPHYLAVDTAGKFGYIVDWGTCCPEAATITGVTVDASGNLTQITGSPFTTGGVSFPAQIVLGY